MVPSSPIKKGIFDSGNDLAPNSKSLHEPVMALFSDAYIHNPATMVYILCYNDQNLLVY